MFELETLSFWYMLDSSGISGVMHGGGGGGSINPTEQQQKHVSKV